MDITVLQAPTLAQPDLRQRIAMLEREMLAVEQVEIPPSHFFAEGLYAREILIPKGTLLTGHMHAKSHVNIISKGSIEVMTEDGYRRIDAPCTFVARPGTKRVGYALEDTVWTTIHASELTDVAELEAELLILPSEARPCLM